MADKLWRFRIERLPGQDDLVLRLPFHLGISFWPPWWRLMFGIARNDIGLQWNLGCFAGEMWIDRPWPEAVVALQQERAEAAKKEA